MNKDLKKNLQMMNVVVFILTALFVLETFVNITWINAAGVIVGIVAFGIECYRNLFWRG